MSRFGLAVRLIISGRTSVQYCFGSPFSSERLWFVATVLWLCPSLPTETLKWLSSLPILMQKSLWWWQCSDRYIISLSPPPPCPLPPFSPSLISRTVSVDVKHDVYLLWRCESRRRVFEDYFYPAMTQLAGRMAPFNPLAAQRAYAEHVLRTTVTVIPSCHSDLQVLGGLNTWKVRKNAIY